MQRTEIRLSREQNNFDLLRLAAAMLVLLSHSFDVRGIASDEPLRQLTAGKYIFSTFGLIVFFSMSGFLVCKSLLQSASVKKYLIKRFLRIWPAYTVCNIVCVLTIGLIFTWLSLQAFLTDTQTLKFIFRNALLLNATAWLPGVFNGESVNASIWTIPVEVKLYLLLLLLFLVGVFRKKFILVVIYIGLLAIKTFIPPENVTNVLGFNLVGLHGLSDFFVGGAVCWLYKDRLAFRFLIWLALLIIWLCTYFFLPFYLHFTESPFFIYSIVLFGSYINRIPFIKADLSYGVYLYAFPVQQVVKHTINEKLNFFQYNVVVITATLLLAALSWHLIEKKALALKPRPHPSSPSPN